MKEIKEQKDISFHYIPTKENPADIASRGTSTIELQRNQRTSGPVNAHLTPGPGIYFNAFIHVYSPRAGADNPLGTNVDVNIKLLSLCSFVASF